MALINVHPTNVTFGRSANMSPTPTTDRDLKRIGALLDRLDPTIDGVCDVAGCIHHSHHEPQLAAAGAGTV